MVKIRLTRVGKKGAASYRVIAINSREKRDSKAIEYLGFYNPRSKPSTFEVNPERIKYWFSVGAVPTQTVAFLLAKKGLYKIETKQKFSKKPGKKKTERAKKKEEDKNVKKGNMTKQDVQETDKKQKIETNKPEKIKEEVKKTEKNDKPSKPETKKEEK